MNRAAIIVTDEHSVAWSASDEPLCYVTDTSEQLLADLRLLLGFADHHKSAVLQEPMLRDAVAHVRAALPAE